LKEFTKKGIPVSEQRILSRFEDENTEKVLASLETRHVIKSFRYGLTAKTYKAVVPEPLESTRRYTPESGPTAEPMKWKDVRQKLCSLSMEEIAGHAEDLSKYINTDTPAALYLLLRAADKSGSEFRERFGIGSSAKSNLIKTCTASA